MYVELKVEFNGNIEQIDEGEVDRKTNANPKENDSGKWIYELHGNADSSAHVIEFWIEENVFASN